MRTRWIAALIGGATAFTMGYERPVLAAAIWRSDPVTTGEATGQNGSRMEARSLLLRGAASLGRHEYALALIDLDKVLATQPDNYVALAYRALTKTYVGDVTGARRDAQAVLKLDVSTKYASYARGVLALENHDLKAQVAAMSQALAFAPVDVFALSWRARAEHDLHQDDVALTDAVAVLQLRPGDGDVALLKANIEHARGDEAGALATMKSALAANPEDEITIAATAEMMRAVHNSAAALVLLDGAIKNKPSAMLYYNRAFIRPKAELAGREADLMAALVLEPNSIDALIMEGQLKAERGDRPGALMMFDRGLRLAPGDIDLLINRAEVYNDNGQAPLAERDFATARAEARTTKVLNNLCWAMATHRIALNAALSNCDAALAAAPDNVDAIDSRGLVLLQLSRNDDALAAYDMALAARPTPGSRFGRAVALARLGRRAEAVAALAEALRGDPDIERTYAGYGVAFPAATTALNTTSRS